MPGIDKPNLDITDQATLDLMLQQSGGEVLRRDAQRLTMDRCRLKEFESW